MAEDLIPVFRHLQSLKLKGDIGEPIIKILSQQWPELKTLSFESVYSISSEDIEEVLKVNSQLRALLLRNCDNIRESCVIESMAVHTPLIEHFRLLYSERGGFCENGSLSELRNLKRLDLYIGMDLFESALEELATVNSSLEHLSINSGRRICYYDQFDAEFVQALLRFKKLKTLWLFDIPGLRPSEMINIVENLVELARLKLNGCLMKGDQLLELIRKGKNIQKLDILHGCKEGVVNKDVFLEMVNAVQSRCDKNHLKVVLWSTQISVPANLLKAHSEHVSFVINPVTPNCRSLCEESDENMFGF